MIIWMRTVFLCEDIFIPDAYKISKTRFDAIDRAFKSYFLFPIFNYWNVFIKFLKLSNFPFKLHSFFWFLGPISRTIKNLLSTVPKWFILQCVLCIMRILICGCCVGVLRPFDTFKGHFERGQLTYPNCSWASLLGSLPVFSAYSFASNWQLPFLNQRKGENGRGRDHTFNRDVQFQRKLFLYRFYVSLSDVMKYWLILHLSLNAMWCLENAFANILLMSSAQHGKSTIAI